MLCPARNNGESLPLRLLNRAVSFLLLNGAGPNACCPVAVRDVERASASSLPIVDVKFAITPFVSSHATLARIRIRMRFDQSIADARATFATPRANELRKVPILHPAATTFTRENIGTKTTHLGRTLRW